MGSKFKNAPNLSKFQNTTCPTFFNGLQPNLVIILSGLGAKKVTNSLGSKVTHDVTGANNVNCAKKSKQAQITKLNESSCSP